MDSLISTIAQTNPKLVGLGISRHDERLDIGARGVAHGAGMKVVVYHNQNCGTSRKVLGQLRERGLEPEVIEYLKTPPTRADMRRLLKDMSMKPRDILRPRTALHDQLGLENPALSDEALLDALEAHPILMERPIVVSPKGTRVCRPAERLNEIVPL